MNISLENINFCYQPLVVFVGIFFPFDIVLDAQSESNLGK